MTILRTPLPTTLGRHSDGNALTLVNDKDGRRFWQFRFTVNGRDGKVEWPLTDYTLAEARQRASDWRKMIDTGIDPRRAGLLDKVNNVTFHAYALANYKDLSVGKNDREEESYLRAINQLKDLWTIPVAQITRADVLAALKPVYREKPKKAERLRWRLERLLEAAVAEGILEHNPAAWAVVKGALRELKQAGVDDQGQHASLPYAGLPELMNKLSYDDTLSARCAEIIALVVVRGQELRGADWNEFVGLDTDKPVWVAPRSRMKCKKRPDKTTKQGVPHVVPLSPQVVELLRALPSFGQGGFVFPSPMAPRKDKKTGKAKPPQPLSHSILGICLKRHVENAAEITAHGLRATFRTWVDEQRKGDHENGERALDHVVGSAMARAYIRSEAFTYAEERRELMAAWAAFALPAQAETNVVTFSRAA